MLTINKKIYVPLERINEYANVPKQHIFELMKEKKVRSYNVNGHFMVCLDDAKEAERWILTKLS
jgi:UDP-N-acetylglucosamine pyrophosphorylase